MRTAVCITSYKDYKKTSYLLPKILEKIKRAEMIVIWDNGSPGKELRLFLKSMAVKDKRVVLILHTDNVGKLAHRWMARLLCHGYDFILKIDPDVTVPGGFEDVMLEAMTEYPNLASVSLNIYPWQSDGQLMSPDKLNENMTLETLPSGQKIVLMTYAKQKGWFQGSCAPGACKMIRSKSLELIDGYPRTVFCADFLLHAKFLQSGMLNGILIDCCMKHHSGGSGQTHKMKQGMRHRLKGLMKDGWDPWDRDKPAAEWR